MPAADVYRALWRHRVLIILLTIVAGIAAYAFTRTQPKIYEASALVRIQQRAPNSDETYGSVSSLELGQRLAQTYARIVQTNSIRQRVADEVSGNVPIDDVTISASPVGDVELLSISARSERPRAAATVANATTTALRSFITETGTLRDQIVVIDSAGVPSVPVSPRTKLTVALAILVAFLFNGALALGREFFADRLPEVDEWHERLGRPVLATVPTLNLKPYSTALRLAPELPDRAVTMIPTQAISGPSRWSVDVPEAQGSGQ